MTRDRVVVLFSSGPDLADRCDLSHCPMSAHGLFTQAEAELFVENTPGWMQAHVLRVEDVTDRAVSTQRP